MLKGRFSERRDGKMQPDQPKVAQLQTDCNDWKCVDYHTIPLTRENILTFINDFADTKSFAYFGMADVRFLAYAGIPKCIRGTKIDQMQNQHVTACIKHNDMKTACRNMWPKSNSTEMTTAT